MTKLTQVILDRLAEPKTTVERLMNLLDRVDGRLEGVEATIYAIHAELDI